MTDKINSRKLTDAELNKDLHKQIKALNITIGELKSELQESEARLKAEKPENSKLHTYKSQLKSTRIKHKKLQIAYYKIQHEMILSKSIKDKEVDAEEAVNYAVIIKHPFRDTDYRVDMYKGKPDSHDEIRKLAESKMIGPFQVISVTTKFSKSQPKGRMKDLGLEEQERQLRGNKIIDTINQQLEDGRYYLMGVKRDEITIEDALEAFGFGRNGLNQ